MADTPKSTASDGADKAADHSTYRLKVTAGPAYDLSTHKIVPVNAPETLTFENDHMIISTAVRIRKFSGFPPESPETSPYFTHSLHTWDQYSISFSFIPKVDISGNELVFGNDFDRPIRDRLPPGFNQAFKIVKWWIDPGLDGDVYSDTPYLYGPALSSWNVFRVGERVISEDDLENKKDSLKWKIPNSESFHETVVEEGADGSGEEVRSELHMPKDSAGRKKYYLTEAHREDFTFEAGRLYQSDFGNPYLDFNDFSLKLPGFSLNVIKYVDSGTHELRYTLKNKATGEVYMAVLFTLLWGEELKEEQARWEKGEGHTPQASQKKAAAATPAEKKEEHNTIDDDDDEDVD